MKKYIVLIFCILILSGCATGPQDSVQGIAESVKSNESELNNSVSEKPASESNEEESEQVEAQVIRVVDGDTVEVKIDGKESTVRLLLVDTPESVHPNEPVQPFGIEASDFGKKTLSGKTVKLQYDGPKWDKYDRLLAYLWVDGKNFNQLLVEEGLARVAYVYDPPYIHLNTLIKAEEKARSEKKKIWSIPGYVTDDGFLPPEEISDPTHQKVELPYDPNGPDRDCNDFSDQKTAQAFFEAAGGPGIDPHRLDGDGDGFVCENN